VRLENNNNTISFPSPTFLVPLQKCEMVEAGAGSGRWEVTFEAQPPRLSATFLHLIQLWRAFKLPQNKPLAITMPELPNALRSQPDSHF
jgi:hypothetical protein